MYRSVSNKDICGYFHRKLPSLRCFFFFYIIITTLITNLANLVEVKGFWWLQLISRHILIADKKYGNIAVMIGNKDSLTKLIK